MFYANNAIRKRSAKRTHNARFGGFESMAFHSFVDVVSSHVSEDAVEISVVCAEADPEKGKG